MTTLLLLTIACTAPDDDTRDPERDDTALPDDDSGVPDSGDSVDSAADTDSGADSGDSGADSGGDTDTVEDTGYAVTRVFDGLTRVVDAVVSSDGLVYASGEGTAGAGVYRWDGSLTRVRALDAPGALAAGTDGNVYAIDGADILRVSDGATVDGPSTYAPAALDLMATSQGDRLTFGGRDPRNGAIAAYTVKAAGGAVALVGDGYTSAPRWLYRPGGETVWTLHDDGHLWLVPAGSDSAVDVGSGFPVGGLGGSADGSTLYMGDDAGLAVYDTRTEGMAPYPLDVPGGSVVSVHAEADGGTLLLGVQFADGAAVYRCATP
jgi:hypothetical protein